MEDIEIPYENGNYLISDAYYIDVSWGMTIKKLTFQFSIENLFGFNNQDYSIDPFLVGEEDVAETIQFSHETNFQFSVSIAYSL